jgi:hypothetical protein
MNVIVHACNMLYQYKSVVVNMHISMYILTDSVSLSVFVLCNLDNHVDHDACNGLNLYRSFDI